MLPADAGAADLGLAEPHPTAVPAKETELGRQREQPRPRRFGRRRGPVPVGECFVARLGPVDGEPFVRLDDPATEPLPPRPSPDTPIEDLTFVALDCETTGRTPHHLVELGAVAFTLRGHIASFETLVHARGRINPYARRLHGITPEMLAGAPPASRVLERFRRFAAGAVLVEHSADAFDTRLISRTLGEPLDNDSLDTSRLAAKLWDLRDTIGLERLCAELGVSHRRPHHALADAEATAACFLALLERGRERFGWHTLGDLLADGQPPRPRTLPEPPRRRSRRPATAAAEPAGPAASAPDADETTGSELQGRRRRRRHRGTRGRGRRRPAPLEVSSEVLPLSPAADDA